MAENPNLNQTLDRRREANITADGLEIWQKYLTFGSTVAYYWGDALHAAQASVNQMISMVQNRKAA